MTTPDNLSQYTDERGMGVAILLVDTIGPKILLGRRRNSYGAGKWGLPAGRLRLHEPIDESMKRELEEETGVTPVVFQYLGVVRDFQDALGGSFIHFAYLCSSYRGEIVNREPDKCEGWHWFDMDDVPSDMVRGHRLALDLMISRQSVIESF